MDHALERLEELGIEWDLFEQEMGQIFLRYMTEEQQKEAHELLDQGRRTYWDTHNIHLAA